LQDQVQLLQKQMRLMVEEAKVKDAAIRKKDEEMEAKDKEIARLRGEAYGIEQIDVDTGRVEVVEHLGQESPAKRLRRQAQLLILSLSKAILYVPSIATLCEIMCIIH